MLIPGDPVPSLRVRGLKNPNFSFDSVAGRHIVVTFVESFADSAAAALFERLHARIGPFDDRFASLFLVTADPRDEESGVLRERYPGLRVFIDGDGAMAAQFGLAEARAQLDPAPAAMTWILDPGLRVVRVIAAPDLDRHDREILSALKGMEAPEQLAAHFAPVLVVPRVLESGLCEQLLDYAAAQGLEESGFMVSDPATGQTVLSNNHQHKRRLDCTIEDARLRDALQARVKRRLVPAIQRAFQFTATRMERYLIACYDAETGGHFRPHKDNTTLGTAHRRFAVSLGLNAEGYDGGDLRFPEFGMRTYRPPTGGAVVFSCSLLHEVMPVTRGRRFAVLPFLYDEAAAALRLENAQHLADEQLRENVIRSTAPPADTGMG